MRENCLSGGNGGSALVTGPFYPISVLFALIWVPRKLFKSLKECKRSVPMQRGAWKCVWRVYRATELAWGRSEGAGWL